MPGDQKGSVPEDRDAPMTLEKARQIARAVAHRTDGTSQALAKLELSLWVAEYRLKSFETKTGTKFESDVRTTCTKCGHEGNLFIDDEAVRSAMKHQWNARVQSRLLIHVWRLLVVAFAAGLLFGLFAHWLWRAL